MKMARSISEFRTLRASLDGTVGFVPTMGALHAGHLSLVEAARSATDNVVVSVFVNPLQFGPAEDLDRYPRDESGDLDKLEDAGVAVAFLPSVEEMYPDGAVTTVSVGRLGAIFEGALRPGHFDGVATVVTKLFNIVRPDVAVFGQKDAQQVAVIEQLVADLDYQLELLIAPTEREADGLALSSRNAYLNPKDRSRAPVLYRGLRAGAETFTSGGNRVDVQEAVTKVLAEEDIEAEYIAVVDPRTFEAPAEEGPVLLAAAARFGGTRLIDNVVVDRGTRAAEPGAPPQGLQKGTET